jgi:hypothetical protein
MSHKLAKLNETSMQEEFEDTKGAINNWQR